MYLPSLPTAAGVRFPRGRMTRDMTKRSHHNEWRTNMVTQEGRMSHTKNVGAKCFQEESEDGEEMKPHF